MGGIGYLGDAAECKPGWRPDRACTHSNRLSNTKSGSKGQGASEFSGNRMFTRERECSCGTGRKCASGDRALVSVVVKSFCSLAFLSFFSGYSLASPVDSRLLPLIPPGAEIVSGAKNNPSPHNPTLLLATHNNRLDLDDWQSLTGADNKRALEEIIEVAASVTGSSLSEHMLLVSGRFDKERIFRSIEENGAPSTEYRQQSILVIKPLARERGDMPDTRWMAILDNRTGILGTPRLVQLALCRYADHAVPDSVLEERLRLFRSDVTSWNVLSNTLKDGKKFLFAEPGSLWAELQQDADLVAIAAHFGSKIRVDFSIHAEAAQRPEFSARKSRFFTEALAGKSNRELGSSNTAHHRLGKFSLDSKHVEGSLELSSNEFESWREHLFHIRPPGKQPPAHGD